MKRAPFPSLILIGSLAVNSFGVIRFLFRSLTGLLFPGKKFTARSSRSPGPRTPKAGSIHQTDELSGDELLAEDDTTADDITSGLKSAVGGLDATISDTAGVATPESPRV